jgi:hypothetical protein
MGTDETYQGWTNRETWALMLHINNDQGLYEMFRQIVRDYPDDQERAVRGQVEELLNPAEYREMYGTAQPEGIEMMAHEVGSLWRVNWSEVVEALTEE